MTHTHAIDYASLLSGPLQSIPLWEFGIAGLAFVFGLLFLFFSSGAAWMHRLGIFHAFETLRMRKKDIDKEFEDTSYIEITIPKNLETKAFQIQQKIFKALHSVYSDPIAGQHNFSKAFYLFQKWYRLWKVTRSPVKDPVSRTLILNLFSGRVSGLLQCLHKRSR